MTYTRRVYIKKVKHHAKRVTTAVIGGAVLLVGLVAIPYPGPGWLIVFAGLAILATEFAWAQRVLARVKGLYDRWVSWLLQQPLYVKLFVASFTVGVVLTTLYLLNTFGLIATMFHINLPWLSSPFFR